MTLVKTAFIDIETVPRWKTWAEVPESMKTLYVKKMKKEFETTPIEKDPHEEIWKKAALFPEFNKIACISAGWISPARELKLRSFADQDEKILLTKFIDFLDKFAPSFICAHNGLEFDFPVLGKRMLINRIQIPVVLRMMGKKSWNLPQLLDTQELWSMGVFNSRISLDLLCQVFGIPSPKMNAKGEEMNGSLVADILFDEARPMDARIADVVYYCEGDVIAGASVYLAITGQEPVAKVIRSNASA